VFDFAIQHFHEVHDGRGRIKMTGEELGLYSMLFVSALCQLVELGVGATQSGICGILGLIVLSGSRKASELAMARDTDPR
jgi:hypothetical protein